MPRHRSSSSSPTRGPSQRQLRVGELLRHALSEVLRDSNIRDPDLSVPVTITEVRPSPDMRHASVFCQPLGGQNTKTVVDALNRHRGYFRGELGKRIELKFTPELRFLEDTSFAEAERIAKLLNSERVARDLKSSGEADGDGQAE
jgi:ribosome-binding factor A